MTEKGLIVYNSSTGFTEEYCAELARRTGLRSVPWKEARRLRGFPEIVVFGTWLHAGKVLKLREGVRLFRRRGARTVAVAVTGASPSVSEDELAAMMEKSLGGESFDGPAFYLPAGLRYERMRPVDRLLMKGLQGMLRGDKKDPENSRRMLEAVSSSFDISSPEHLVPVAQAVNALLGGE